jgi:phosphatidylserine decarboxylase
MIFAWIGGSALAALLGAFALWRFWYFHRNPPRAIVPGSDLLCAADGRVIFVEEVELGPSAAIRYHARVHEAFGAQGRWQVIGTFLSMLDVHVVRAPIAGRVRLRHIPAPKNQAMGAAFLASALRRPLPVGQRGYEDKNEFLGIEVEGESRVLIVLMADWWIDQIVPFVTDGATVERGASLGLIRMGSQVDVFTPPGDFQPVRKVGDRVRAGDMVLGKRAKS